MKIFTSIYGAMAATGMRYVKNYRQVITMNGTPPESWLTSGYEQANDLIHSFDVDATGLLTRTDIRQPGKTRKGCGWWL